MNLPDLVIWLRERTALSSLKEEVLKAIAPLLKQRNIEAGQTIVTANTVPDGLYILNSGRAESYFNSFLPGTVINLKPLLLGKLVTKTIITVSNCELWWLEKSDFMNLVSEYPEITQAFSQQLAEEIAELSNQLLFEQERSLILRPYLVTKARRGIIGKSRYAQRLRQQIKEAAQTRESVLIFGEPGLEKDNIAALIHFGSPLRREAIIKVNCNTLQASGAELFGRSGGKPGLIAALGRGTLIFNNLQELPPELIQPLQTLLKKGIYAPVGTSDNPTPQTSQARIILISEKTVSEIDSLVGQSVKVPPLRVRKADLEDTANYYITLICRAKGIISKPHITPEALRRLQAYDFPNNIRELHNLIERAMIQLGERSSLTEEIIWPSQSKKKQFRWNLLNAYPRLRYFLRSPWWPDRLNYGFTLTVFALIVAILFLGPQTRDQNFALNLFWAWWWPLILIGFPFVGRLWCAICPFMIYGEVTQKLSLWLFPRKLKNWPREKAEKYGGWFLFSLFALIFLWEELWNLENTAYLSACLLLLITAGAMIFSAIFERRFWCRYLCPIGGMNGMFAKLSMIELRAQQGTCSAECSTYQCYKGGPQKGEGMASLGCPLYSHPAQLEDNKDCVLCMTCLKACPHRSVEVNLRPPGIELWTTHKPRLYEVALLFLLLNAVFLHHLAAIQSYLGWSLNLANFWIHLGMAIAALTLPALIPILADSIRKSLISPSLCPKPRSFIE
ncbi:sigma 54-interacting transcriptional regulator, partial [Gloeocapsa sp. PCC 73106]|uniref:sigma 54-interacting transcriptional regulator n=1 Tax=Gloeocapsa sp. PCC 73106 TaxID=102232 RepID=UPI0002ABB7B1